MTRPGFTGCLNCLWLPTCATSYQPSCFKRRMTSRLDIRHDTHFLHTRQAGVYRSDPSGAIGWLGAFVPGLQEFSDGGPGGLPLAARQRIGRERVIPSREGNKQGSNLACFVPPPLIGVDGNLSSLSSSGSRNKDASSISTDPWENASFHPLPQIFPTSTDRTRIPGIRLRRTCELNPHSVGKWYRLRSHEAHRRPDRRRDNYVYYSFVDFGARLLCVDERTRAPSRHAAIIRTSYVSGRILWHSLS